MARIADLSVYVGRAARGSGVGVALVTALERRAKTNAFRKIVLFALTKNERALGLYVKFGYREIGVFREHGAVDGKYEDVIAMEKLL